MSNNSVKLVRRSRVQQSGFSAYVTFQNLATQVATEATAAAEARRTTDDTLTNVEAHLRALPALHQAITALQASVESGPRAAPVGLNDKVGVGALLATEDKVSAARRPMGLLGCAQCSVFGPALL